MQNLDQDWIKKQLSKLISTEESVMKAERDHFDKAELSEIRNMYDSIIRSDESHLNDLKRIASKYGFKEEGGVMESAGTLLGGMKSAMESVGTSDPYQTVADDLVLKGTAFHSGRIWANIFRNLGDNTSAVMMEEAASDDQSHLNMMEQILINIGTRESRGEDLSRAA
ncbi:MAG: hypothetical protein ACYC27_20480 [Armatimonadota bacterium]